MQRVGMAKTHALAGEACGDAAHEMVNWRMAPHGLVRRTIHGKERDVMTPNGDRERRTAGLWLLALLPLTMAES